MPSATQPATDTAEQIAAHTPGPWTLDTFPDYVDGTDMEVLDADGFPIASVEATPIINRWDERFPGLGHWGLDERTHKTFPQEEVLANARLIVAAPDLLEAAREGLICAEADVEEARQACIEHGEDPEADQFVKVFTERRDLIAAAIAKATGETGQ